MLSVQLRTSVQTDFFLRLAEILGGTHKIRKSTIFFTFGQNAKFQFEKNALNACATTPKPNIHVHSQYFSLSTSWLSFKTHREQERISEQVSDKKSSKFSTYKIISVGLAASGFPIHTVHVWTRFCNTHTYAHRTHSNRWNTALKRRCFAPLKTAAFGGLV